MMTKELLGQAKAIEDIEELHYIDESHNYRYERKFTVPDEFSLKTVEQFIKRNTALFREVFHLRQVNNIYFDTAGYNDYFDFSTKAAKVLLCTFITNFNLDKKEVTINNQKFSYDIIVSTISIHEKYVLNTRELTYCCESVQLSSLVDSKQ